VGNRAKQAFQQESSLLLTRCDAVSQGTAQVLQLLSCMQPQLAILQAIESSFEGNAAAWEALGPLAIV